MPRSFKWRRVLLEVVAEWIALGWRAVGCVPICEGLDHEVLMVLEPDDSLSGGEEATPAGWEG